MPGLHTEQFDALDSEYVPAPHGEQLAASKSEYVPGLHLEQFAAPQVGLYFLIEYYVQVSVVYKYAQVLKRFALVLHAVHRPKNSII